MTTPTIYFKESYIPSWLAHDRGYNAAFKERIESLMEMQEFNIIEIGEPFILPTPDCEPAPGMVTLRVEAIVTEFDFEIPMTDDPEEQASAPIQVAQASEKLDTWEIHE